MSFLDKKENKILANNKSVNKNFLSFNLNNSYSYDSPSKNASFSKKSLNSSSISKYSPLLRKQNNER
jgi:hypothetical protein